jgi:hypothetical protein
MIWTGTGDGAGALEWLRLAKDFDARKVEHVLGDAPRLAAWSLSIAIVI